MSDAMEARIKLEQIAALLANKLPIQYIGFRLRGRAEDMSREDRSLAVVSGIFPAGEETVTFTADDVMVQRRLFSLHQHFLAFLDTSLDSQQAAFRRSIGGFSLRPDILAQQAGFDQALRADGGKLADIRLVEADGTASLYNLPTAMITWFRVPSLPKLHVSLWHGRDLSSSMALELIQQKTKLTDPGRKRIVIPR